MFALNKGQQKIVNEAVKWYYNGDNQVFQYSGNAGTGKSVVLNAIIKRLGLSIDEIAPMSFIGAAAIVMRLKGLTNAKTIHSWLFNPVERVKVDKNGFMVKNDYLDRPIFGIDFEPKPLDHVKLIVIDEAGAVPRRIKSETGDEIDLKYEIESRGIKIIACGDLDQLPPVGDEPAYLTSGKIYILDEIMRQSEGSAIVYLAQRAKQGLPIHKGNYGNVLVIDNDELTSTMLERSDMVICGKNITRDKINTTIRNNIGYFSNIPNYGERLVCRKNNWKLENNGINLANGLIGTVVNQPDVSRFDGKTFSIDFRPDMLNTPFTNIQCDYNYFTAPSDLKYKYKYSKYNMSEKFEFAYCITTHISQGSQYKHGTYIEEYLNKDINKNLNYTGITRFSDAMIYVKQKRKFY